MKEVQYVSVKAEQKYELTKITITNADDGQFLLVFQNPNDLSMSNSNPISSTATAKDVEKAVEGYYNGNSYIGSYVNVNLTWYDVDGAETVIEEEAVSRIYFIQLRRLIEGTSVSSIQVIKTTTAATITVDLP